MYEPAFQLQRRPFAAAPSAADYFAAPGIEAARLTLARCIERAEGAGFLVGAAGTGKSLLCQVLAEQFADRFHVALLTNGHLNSRRDLLQLLSFELGLPYRNLEEGELRLALIDYLVRSGKCPQGILLIVDEAHTLPLRLLEELRLMTNLVRAGQPCVRLLLAGGPVLEEHFASPRLESFSQRLAARCYLSAMARGETCDYIRFQITQAGGRPEAVFGDDALEAVYRATDGVPRLINQVCDHALLLAYSDGRTRLDAEIVENAWSDLQQLPAPWGAAAQRPAAQTAEVLEFGGLEDELPESGSSSAEQEFESFPLGDDLRASAVIAHDLDRLHADIADLDEAFDDGAGYNVNLELSGRTSAHGAPAINSPGSAAGNASSDLAALQSESFEQDEAVVDPWPAAGSVSLDAWAQAESICQASTSDDLAVAAPAEHHDGLLEEELVFDPYAAMDAQQVTGGSLFYATSEQSRRADAGRSADHVLSPFDAPRAVTSGSMEQMLTLAEALLLDEASPSPTIPFQIVSADDDLGPEDLQPIGEAGTVALAANDSQFGTVETTAGASAGADDHDLIVVENTVRAAAPGPLPPAAAPPAAVRRQEYKQLFARLRRG